MNIGLQIIPVTVDPDGDAKQIECVPVEIARQLESDLYEGAKIIRRLLSYADKTAENYPRAVTSAGQNARVRAGLWLAEFERKNQQNPKVSRNAV